MNDARIRMLDDDRVTKCIILLYIVLRREREGSALGHSVFRWELGFVQPMPDCSWPAKLWFA
jgi:hypothetical protein